MTRSGSHGPDRSSLGAAGASGAAGSAETAVAAIDLGATSGRVIVGRLAADDGSADRGPVLRTELVARFSNEPVDLRDGLHWDIPALYRSALEGLAKAEREAPGEIGSIGIDSWAVNYGLLRGGTLLENPFHYRDPRHTAAVPSVHAKIPADELFRRNGLQHLDFNTIFLLAAEDPAILKIADRMLLLPDLLACWLTGEEVAERSNASTTGLLDPVTREWDLDLASRLGLSHSLLPRLVDAGERIGELGGTAAATVGRAIPVTAVGSHDTASAVAAVPASGRDFAYISCGTWGLVGLELDAPVLSDAVREANFTNEGGVDGRTRFLRNVMGTWLFSETLKTWQPGSSNDDRNRALIELLDEARRYDGPVPVFDVDDPVFAGPGDMPARIDSWCREHGERAPEGRIATIRSIVESLAAAYVATVREAAELANHEVSTIHIVGGGSQNRLLCQRIADLSGLPVIAGPVEATAMGNMLVQIRALGQLPPELQALRDVVARSAELTAYAPR